MARPRRPINLNGFPRDDASVNLDGQSLDALRKRSDGLRQGGVLLHQFHQQSDLLGCGRLSFFAGTVEILPMLRIRDCMRLVPVRLTRLGQKDERRRISGLSAESQVEKDERVEIERGYADRIQKYPDGNNERLGNQEDGRAEESRKGLGLEGEPIVAEGPGKMQVGAMESK